jgi:hypothetical protein
VQGLSKINKAAVLALRGELAPGAPVAHRSARRLRSAIALRSFLHQSFSKEILMDVSISSGVFLPLWIPGAPLLVAMISIFMSPRRTAGQDVRERAVSQVVRSMEGRAGSLRKALHGDPKQRHLARPALCRN